MKQPQDLIYLASPYTHQDRAVRDRRAMQAAKAAAYLFRQGCHVFAPIPHGHFIAEFGLPVEYDFWQSYCQNMLSRCDRMIILTLQGWEVSTGVTDEHLHMLDLGKDVGHLDMSEVVD